MFPLPREACPGGPTPFTWVNPRKESAILALQIEYVHGRGYVQWVVNGFSEWLQLTRCGALSRQRRGRASTASMWVPQVINRMPRNSPRTVKGTALWSTTLLITTSRMLIELAAGSLLLTLNRRHWDGINKRHWDGINKSCCTYLHRLHSLCWDYAPFFNRFWKWSWK